MEGKSETETERSRTRTTRVQAAKMWGLFYTARMNQRSDWADRLSFSFNTFTFFLMGFPVVLLLGEFPSRLANVVDSV